MGEPKSGWSRVKFGDVVVNSTRATKDFEAEGFTRYIIGQHIPADGGRITTWNPVGDAEFGSRIRTIIRSGDVLCTTRGPHLKVAVATFDCLSAHTNFVLRPKDNSLLLPEVLEALVRTEGFQDHLRKHFRGSTNLFVNWSDAAQYEFALPPLDAQVGIAALLVSHYSAVEALGDAVLKSVVLRDAYLESTLSSCAVRPLQELVHEARVGVVVKPQSLYTTSDDGVPALMAENVLDGALSKTVHTRFRQDAHAKNARSRLRSRDVVVTRRGFYAGRAAAVTADQVGWNCVDLILLDCGSALEPGFLSAYLCSRYGQEVLQSFIIGTDLRFISANDLLRMKVPAPAIADQLKVTATLTAIKDAGTRILDRQDTLRRNVALATERILGAS